MKTINNTITTTMMIIIKIIIIMPYYVLYHLKALLRVASFNYDQNILCGFAAL